MGCCQRKVLERSKIVHGKTSNPNAMSMFCERKIYVAIRVQKNGNAKESIPQIIRTELANSAKGFTLNNCQS